ncbi:hypothetical protein MC885_002947, partial [Smutsia gigantea]
QDFRNVAVATGDRVPTWHPEAITPCSSDTTQASAKHPSHQDPTVCECRDNGNLLSSKGTGSGAFSKLYLAYATHKHMQHNPKLPSDLQGKRHTGLWSMQSSHPQTLQVAIVSSAEALVEFSRKFLPR